MCGDNLHSSINIYWIVSNWTHWQIYSL